MGSIPTGLIVFLAAIVLASLVALVRFIINHHKHHIETMRAPAYNLSSPAQKVVEEQPEADATDEEAGDEEEEYEGDEYVYDIQSSDDSDLELAEGEQAILMFFFNNCNEVCDKEWNVVKELSDKWQDKVRFVSVDATDPSTSTIAAFHNVHNVPAFVLRRRGAVEYTTLIGAQDKTQLDSFVEQGLNGGTQAQAVPQS